jgi:hypothetical protein
MRLTKTHFFHELMKILFHRFSHAYFEITIKMLGYASLTQPT